MTLRDRLVERIRARGPITFADFTVNPMIRARQIFLRGAGHEAIDRALASMPGRLVDYSTHPGATLSAFGWPACRM